jgi:uncharacterized membrane protein
MDNKSWYASKTIWGVVLSLGGKVVAGVFGVEVSEAETAQLTDSVVAFVSVLVSFVGDALAFYGRVKATKKIAK